MPNDTLYLLDQLESADMLEIDGLHAWEFSLSDDLLDRADAAAVADEHFASEEIVLRVEALDGRERHEWRFTYNAVMEARYLGEEGWSLFAEGQEHRLRCLGGVSVSADDE